MFKITIEETKTVTKLTGKDWAIVGTKEVARERQFYSDDSKEPKTYMENVYGYTPEIEKEVTQTRQILCQEVETLDLPAVIKAINNL